MIEMKRMLLAAAVVVVMVGSLQADVVVDDDFSGASLDTALWTVSGSASLSGGNLLVNNGGYVKSKAGASVADAAGELTVDFMDVGTSTWVCNDMELGLYSADESSYVKIVQLGYGDYCSLIIKNGDDRFQYRLKAGSTYSGPELRDVGQNQSWRIEVSASEVSVSVNRSNAGWETKVSVANGATTDFSPRAYGDPVNIPTGKLFAKVHCSDPDNFLVSQVNYSAVPEPATMSLLALGGVVSLMRHRSK